MSDMPERIYIHAPPLDSSRHGIYHEAPRDGYNDNVEYIRADVAAEERRELIQRISERLIECASNARDNGYPRQAEGMMDAAQEVLDMEQEQSDE